MMRRNKTTPVKEQASLFQLVMKRVVLCCSLVRSSLSNFALRSSLRFVQKAGGNEIISQKGLAAQNILETSALSQVHIGFFAHSGAIEMVIRV